jgi:hypothetical protein
MRTWPFHRRLAPPIDLTGPATAYPNRSGAHPPRPMAEETPQGKKSASTRNGTKARRLWFWRCKPETSMPLPRRTPNGRPTWATAPTAVHPTTDPGRPGNLTRAQEWRANGGRW